VRTMPQQAEEKLCMGFCVHAALGLAATIFARSSRSMAMPAKDLMPRTGAPLYSPTVTLTACQAIHTTRQAIWEPCSHW
jgi:hypothetical protein